MEEIRNVTCGSFRNFIKRGVKIKKIIVILNGTKCSEEYLIIDIQIS